MHDGVSTLLISDAGLPLRNAHLCHVFIVVLISDCHVSKLSINLLSMQCSNIAMNVFSVSDLEVYSIHVLIAKKCDSSCVVPN